MKIILRDHVENLGDRGDVVNVAPGYARNYLVPKGLAYPAGAGSAKQVDDQRRAWAAREARSEKGAQALASQLSALELSIRRRAGAGGTLYGSVTSGDIVELLVASGYQIDRRKIQRKEPIKSIGDFELAIKLHRNVSANVKLAVLTDSGQTLADIEAAKAALEPPERTPETQEESGDREQDTKQGQED